MCTGAVLKTYLKDLQVVTANDVLTVPTAQTFSLFIVTISLMMASVLYCVFVFFRLHFSFIFMQQVKHFLYEMCYTNNLYLLRRRGEFLIGRLR